MLHQPRLERGFIELLLAESGEGRGAVLHCRDKALLAQDGIHHVVEAGLSRKAKVFSQFLPRGVEAVSSCTRSP